MAVSVSIRSEWPMCIRCLVEMSPSIHAEVGDYVGKGDVLAVIRSGEIADIDKQRKEAEHQLAIANRNLEATQDMARSGMASDRDFLQAQQEQADAEAETKRIQEMYSIIT